MAREATYAVAAAIRAGIAVAARVEAVHVLAVDLAQLPSLVKVL